MKSSKVILLTGASGGVGMKIASDLAKAGHKLALHYHTNEVAALQLQADIRAAGGECMVMAANICDETRVREMVLQIGSNLGPVEVLINNAGINRSSMSWKMTAKDWRETMEVNLTGSFLCSKAVLTGMRSRQWGRIIHIASVVAQTGFPGTSAYAASKAGLIGMTYSMAKEVADKSITVNCIAPGYLDAGMLYTIPEEMREQIRRQIPAGTFGNTNNISACIQYLIRENAGYVTGQTLNINGGMY